MTGAAVRDPGSGLLLYELSHPWGHGAPAYPGFDDVHIHRSVTHARHGVMSQRIRTVMHTGTHVNAPKHLMQRAEGVGSLDLRRFFGNGVVVDCPKEEWELVTAQDLEKSGARIEAGDIVIVMTGWHRHYSDSQRYFAHGPGLDPDAALWLAEREVGLVGVDTAYVDHPLATSLAAHRGGPAVNYLTARYETTTGRRAAEDFPEWNPAHRALLAAGIPTVENVGGDVAALAGRRATFHAMPWRWPEGDACPVRLVAITDPSGDYRVESGS
ncbi:cyclase family protein [Streptomyces sp. NPDC090493]|uniref:cyclase family protein n=1 Tax=Streptomyces sp. NPDC090493 TaxID=3365964 RepID=UPI00380A69F4